MAATTNMGASCGFAKMDLTFTIHNIGHETILGVLGSFAVNPFQSLRKVIVTVSQLALFCFHELLRGKTKLIR